MAITTGAQYAAAAKQIIKWYKTSSVTTVAQRSFVNFTTTGDPAAGTAAFATTPGQVPTDAVTGFPPIDSFGAGNTGYLTRVHGGPGVAGFVKIYDLLYAVSVPLTALATTTITTPPSYAARVPNTDYSNLELFSWVTTAVSATATTATVTYTNQAGTTGKSATAELSSYSGLTLHRCQQYQLASGDSGIQKLESVIVGGTVATTGVVNFCVGRRLWSGRAMVGEGTIPILPNHGPGVTGMPIVYDTSALLFVYNADSTSTGITDFSLEIANG